MGAGAGAGSGAGSGGAPTSDRGGGTAWGPDPAGGRGFLPEPRRGVSRPHGQGTPETSAAAGPTAPPPNLGGPRPPSVSPSSPADPYPLAPVAASGVVFVHVPKTGGTSVARALYGGPGGGHRTVRDYRRELGADALDRAFSFAVVRDPLDRLASAFRYLKAGGSNRLDAAFGARELAAYDTLDAFVRGWLTLESSQGQVHLRPQADFVCDTDGSVAVDRLVPFRRLAAGYEAVRQRTGRGGPLPHLNAGPPGPPPPLSAEARARVGRVYAADYALLAGPSLTAPARP